MQKKEYSGYDEQSRKQKLTCHSRYLGDLSPEQEKTLQKFRAEVQAMGIPDGKYDDAYLLRFLRARKFDLAKTKEMWANFIKWRKENGVDEIGVRNHFIIWSEFNILELCIPRTQRSQRKLASRIFPN